MNEILPEWLLWGELFQWVMLGVLWVKAWDWPLVSEVLRRLARSDDEEDARD